MSVPQKKARNGFNTAELAWDQVTKTSNRLFKVSCLTKDQSDRFKIVRTSKSRGARKHRKFLRRVRDIDLNYHLLFAIAFSQNQIDSTKGSILDELVKRIGEKRDDDIAVIHSYIPPLTADANSPTGQSDVFVHANLEVIREVFGEDMMNKIKIGHGEHEKKGVKIKFPWCPDLLEACLLTLYIREEYVKELAMALFKVEVCWFADAFHVVHHNGMVQIIRHPEFTLKGVLDEDIVAMFTSEIHGAITECSVRARELAEGKRRTECVSMTFSGSGGEISLLLQLGRGCEIGLKFT